MAGRERELSDKNKSIIDAALEAVESLQRELEDLEAAEPVERLRAVLRCRFEWLLRKTIATVVLTGKKDDKEESKTLIGVCINDLVTAQWAETAGAEDVAFVEDEATAGPGMRWKVAMEPSNWSGLDRERLLLAGVSPEQLQAGTVVKNGTKLVVRAVKA